MAQAGSKASVSAAIAWTDNGPVRCPGRPGRALLLLHGNGPDGFSGQPQILAESRNELRSGEEPAVQQPTTPPGL